MAKKQISKDTWSQIKGKYVAGSDPIYKIAQQHDINKKTIERRAKKEGWIYGSVSNNVAKAIENATIDTIIKNDTDRAVKMTEMFLKDSLNIRAVTMALMDAMAKTLKEQKGNITSAEANRLLTCQKVAKTAGETITNIYSSVRKALGVDRDDDIEKARRIKKAEDPNEIIDPTEGMTEEEIDEQLKKFE